MLRGTEQIGFSLLELLVVIAVIAMLAGTLLPSLAAAKELARSTKCLGNLRSLGVSMAMYHAANRQVFWPYQWPRTKGGSYFWGTTTVPVDTSGAPLLGYCDAGLETLWCPSMLWGDYVPQGGVEEATTTYGYNAWCLDPAVWGRTGGDGKAMSIKRATELKNPGSLFVFADSGMFWKPGGVAIFQNSTSLDPVNLGAWGPNTTATTHFRHLGKANALTADGAAASYGLEGGKMLDAEHQLGFVGAENVPHYDQ